MELLWYDIRTLDTDTMAHTVGMMDEERRRRVNDIAGEDDRRRTVAGELLARRLLAQRLGCGEGEVSLNRASLAVQISQKRAQSPSSPTRM